MNNSGIRERVYFDLSVIWQKNRLDHYCANGYSDLIIRHIIRHSGGVIIKSEHEIQNEILLALSKSGTTVCRSNAGKVKTKDGRTIALFPRGWP